MDNIFLALARLHSIRTLDLFEEVQQVVQNRNCVLLGVLSTEYFTWKCITGSEEVCYFYDAITVDFKQKMTTILTNKSLLRSDFPAQTVARFVETGETDPREFIDKKQVGQEGESKFEENWLAMSCFDLKMAENSPESSKNGPK
ncbi:hypothetical protein B9Z55_028673 [Caenorhabditis nigoni]|uniref:Uncharacterized protein n=1 Tax=Caenorhabditis nigoni TaxID=1611254 RepID=A0A2G5SAZ5_9PELO|nr:hypothetical protein B9Z55_028673 [Caenorhabditis nigoni]